MEMIFLFLCEGGNTLRTKSMSTHRKQARGIQLSKDIVAVRAQSLVFDVHMKIF